jgi:hypothetical protein
MLVLAMEFSRNKPNPTKGRKDTPTPRQKNWRGDVMHPENGTEKTLTNPTFHPRKTTPTRQRKAKKAFARAQLGATNP